MPVQVLPIPAVSFDAVSFAYSGEPVLDAASLLIPAGEFALLTGENGAGKSTMLRLILHEVSVMSGCVSVFGKPVSSRTGWRDIGYLAQRASNPNFPASATEVVEMNLPYGRARLSHRAARDAAAQALSEVGMSHCAGRLISGLSGGQLQRVMLARALVSHPRLLLLDEPTGGLDAVSRRALYGTLGKLNERDGVTILMVTHDIGEAEPFSTMVVRLQSGQLETRGAQRREPEDPRKPEVRA